jgi:hypothetical protein
MEPTASVPVRVSGARDECDEMTWGHLAIWQWHGVADEDASFHFFNAERFPMPPGCTVASVTAALAEVLRRYEGLRTVFRRDEGTWRQCVQGSGEIILEVYETGPDSAEQAANDVAQRLNSVPWSLSVWPVRVAVVGSPGSLGVLVIGYNRLALDSNSVTLVALELMNHARAAEGDPPPEKPWQPIEEARFERSPAGLAINDRALQHWRQSLTAGPSSMFDLPLREPEQPRFRRIEILSPAMGRAVRWMHQTWRVLPSAILLAGFSVLLSRYTGHRQVVFQLITGNRPDRERRELVGTLTGQGVFLLDLDAGDLPFIRLTRAAFRASGSAHRFGFCDPEAVNGIREELSQSRGACLDLAGLVNDLVAYDYGTEPQPTEAELRELTSRTVVTDAGGMPMNPTKLDIRLHLTLQHDPDIPLTLMCDTRYMSSDTMRELLGGMERLMVAAACGESDLGALAELSGVTPLRRGPSWVWCGDGWVDVDASRQLWQEVTGAGPTTVLAERSPAGDGTQRLVGYLIGDESMKLSDMHRRCVAALGLRTDVRAPGWYRLLGAPPAQPDDAESWRTAPVLSEGDGR